MSVVLGTGYPWINRQKSVTVDILPDPNNAQPPWEYFRQVITYILSLSSDNKPIGDVKDVFELGMNSLQGIKLFNHLLVVAHQRDTTKHFEPILGRSFVYS